MKIKFDENGYVAGYADDGFDIEGGVEFNKNDLTATFSAENCRFYHMVDGQLLMDVKLKNASNTIAANIQRIDELNLLLQDTIDEALQYAEGAISEEVYAPIRIQRQAWRDEINALEQTIPAS